MSSKFGPELDITYMNQALEQAKKAYRKNEVPIGALVVDQQGKIVARAYNKVETNFSQAEHAEIRAIKKAARKIKNWRLNGYWLYVTLEPCVMCMGLILLSRLDGVVFAADSNLFGFRLDKHIPLWVYKEDALTILSGVCAIQSENILKQFFQKQRKKSEQNQ